METLLRILIEADSQEERAKTAEALQAILAGYDHLRVGIYMALAVAFLAVGYAVYLGWRVDRLERRLGERGQVRQAD